MPSNRTILVTGASGYIGSHTCIELIAAGYNIVALDNLSNSCHAAVSRIEEITGKPLPFHVIDVRDGNALARLLETHPIDAAIHFAGLKAVGESVEKPLLYFDNNVNGSLSLLTALTKAGVRRLVFSSSATVYGNPETVPISESAKLHVTNPYGRSKLMVEQILGDLTRADPRWAIGVLRYFNPVGAHPSGVIGEDPRGIPNNLMPFVAQAAVGRRARLSVFGNDYPTPDGTGVRDYIHVVDLARGHVAAVERLFSTGAGFTVNLGTGQGYSVLEVVRAFAQACGRPIPYEIVGRRPGDIAVCYANPELAHELLGWRAQKDLAEMCADHWRWQNMNPAGFENSENDLRPQAAAVGT
ncbi:MAG: UDP-glucose 4-epimerase GalE [Burkholderiales bacterium]|nr:UDP-glucose 4-epimerase GalE [Burkholderiales bacterium]